MTFYFFLFSRTQEYLNAPSWLTAYLWYARALASWKHVQRRNWPLAIR